MSWNVNTGRVTREQAIMILEEQLRDHPEFATIRDMTARALVLAPDSPVTVETSSGETGLSLIITW